MRCEDRWMGHNREGGGIGIALMTDRDFFFPFLDPKPPRIESGQQDMFPVDRDELLAQSRISIDDLRRWRGKGWLSFEPDEKMYLQPEEDVEVRFLISLCKWGLNDAQIQVLLNPLDKPYRQIARMREEGE